MLRDLFEKQRYMKREEEKVTELYSDGYNCGATARAQWLRK